MVTESVIDGRPVISRFEVSAPKCMSAGSTVQLLADCTAAVPASRLTLSAVPATYTVHPSSIPLNPGTNLVRVRVVVSGPPGHVTIVGRLGDVVREDSVSLDGARKSYP